ncbi:glycosyltransferase [Rhodovibrionaceae bacterium A322]
MSTADSDRLTLASAETAAQKSLAVHQAARILLQKSGLFWESYYVEENNLKLSAGEDAVEHFLTKGASRELKPHPLFDPAHYLSQLQDQADKARANPLFDYLAQRHPEADPSPLFSSAFYRSQAPVFQPKSEPPLVHFLREGSRKGLKAHPLFDPLYYASHSEGWRQRNRRAKTEPLADYLRFGASEASNPHPLFDAVYYRKNHMVGDRADVNPLVAYLCRPSGDQRTPHPLFDPAHYQTNAANALSRSDDPLIDFVTCPEEEDCSPHLFFDLEHYQALVEKQDRKAQVPLLLDFLVRGEKEGLDPHPLFSSAFYKQKYAEDLAEGENPLAHFVVNSRRNHFWPNVLFDPQHYLSASSYLDPDSDCTFTHYILHGRGENVQPHLMFDNGYYLRQLEGTEESQEASPLADYLSRGADSPHSPHPLFDNLYYCTHHSDVKAMAVNPLVHFLDQGADQEQKPHPLFDCRFYLERNPDVEAADRNPLLHYLTTGFQEGRWPNPLFDPTFYLGKREDVAESGDNPLIHYLAHGEREGNQPHALFDPQFYREQWEEGLARETNALGHYLSTPEAWGQAPHALFDPAFYQTGSLARAQSGASETTETDSELPGPLLADYLARCESGEAVNPCLLFDADYYRRGNTDLTDKDDNLLLHYVLHGEAEGRRPHPLFDPTYYQNTYPVARVTQDRGSLSNYLAYGMAAGHNPCALFDVAHYERQLDRDADEDSPAAVLHYLIEGHEGDFDPNPFFANAFYAESYPWCRDQGQTPLGHYMEGGEAAGLLASERFSADYYLGRNPLVGIPADGPLAHYLLNGRYHDYQAMPPKAWCERYHTRRSVLARLQQAYGKKATAKVSATVVIPVFNQLDYTLRCLAALADSEEKLTYEIVVVDDASSDDTAAVLKQLPGIRYVKNTKNLGFIKSCNLGASKAKGTFLAFLNNDTAVKSGWLTALYETFSRFPTAGLVGSKLLYPNGLLQEAGGICWRDGSAANFGNRADPDLPKFNYARDVDYISGAAIMLPRRLFEDLGGFDERYLPAYYEDADLAFKVRDKGYRVLYQPLSQVVHFEGITSGRDVSKGVKKHQVSNQEVFRQTWAHVLEKHGKPGDVSEAVYDRRADQKILIVDACTPTPDRDSGSLSALYYQEIFLDLGYRVSFIPCSNLQHAGTYTAALQKQGVKCLHFPYITSVDGYLAECEEEFDLVLLYRVKEGGAYMETVRKHQPKARVVFDTTDLHYLREERQAELLGDGALKDKAAETKARELSLMRQADATILVSEFERALINEEQPGTQIEVISLALEQPGSKTAFGKRKDICFIGGYQHTPNVDAAAYLVEEIWPLIKAKLPRAKCYLVGSNPPDEVQDLASDDVIVTGYVEDLGDYLDRVKLTVVPLRYGAGVKGKIGSSLSYGVPCVSSPIGVEGMGLVDGENIAVAEAPEAFADKVIELYKDQKLWSRLSEAGLAFAEAEFSINTNRRRLEDLASYLKQPLFTGQCQACGNRGSYEVLGWPVARDINCKSCGADSEDRLLAGYVDAWASSYGLADLSAVDGAGKAKRPENLNRTALLGVGQLSRSSKGGYSIRRWGLKDQNIKDPGSLELVAVKAGNGEDLDVPRLAKLVKSLPDHCDIALAVRRPEGLDWQGHHAWRRDLEEDLAVLGRTVRVDAVHPPDARLLGSELWLLRVKSV